MNVSRFRIVFLSVMAVAALAFAGATFASDEVPSFDDGRVNLYDIASPVAVYCSFDYPYADDVNMGVLSGVEAWALNGNDVFEKVIDVTAQDIAEAAAAVSADTTTLLDSGAGYALYLEDDSSLTLASAGYSFNWTPGDAINC